MGAREVFISRRHGRVVAFDSQPPQFHLNLLPEQRVVNVKWTRGDHAVNEGAISVEWFWEATIEKGVHSV